MRQRKLLQKDTTSCGAENGTCSGYVCPVTGQKATSTVKANAARQKKPLKVDNQ
jgi:hypothetical protein